MAAVAGQGRAGSSGVGLWNEQEVFMKRTLLPLAGALTLGMIALQPVHADYSVEQLHGLLDRSAEYGFTYFNDIDIDDDGQAEVEGWLQGDSRAEVKFSSQGAIVEEKSKRDRERKHSMNDSDIRAAVQAAAGEGLVRIEDIDVNRKEIIEIDGKTADGKDIEVHVRQGSSEVVKVDRDD